MSIPIVVSGFVTDFQERNGENQNVKYYPEKDGKSAMCTVRVNAVLGKDSKTHENIYCMFDVTGFGKTADILSGFQAKDPICVHGTLTDFNVYNQANTNKAVLGSLRVRVSDILTFPPKNRDNSNIPDVEEPAEDEEPLKPNFNKKSTGTSSGSKFNLK